MHNFNRQLKNFFLAASRFLTSGDLWRSQYFQLSLIVVFAYAIRIAPYLLGYNLPFAEEGMRDYEQVLHLLQFRQIAWQGSYFGYGAFPILHLLIYGLAQLGLDSLRLFLFLPQAFASLGLVFVYFFCRRYFSNQQSLLACFLIAAFIPHIYWTAQPMRESLGLFLYPLAIFLFDGLCHGNAGRKKTGLALALAAVLILIIPTHHGSAAILLGWLAFYAIFFLRGRWQLKLAVVTLTLYAAALLAYWQRFFPLGLHRLNALGWWSWLILAAAIAAVYWLGRSHRLDFKRLKERRVRWILLLGLILSLIGLYFLTPLSYPAQVWLSFVCYALLIFDGAVFNDSNDKDRWIGVNILFALLGLLGLSSVFVSGQIVDAAFDPFRLAEFAIYSLSPLAAAGLLRWRQKWQPALPVTVIVLAILSLAAYPAVLIFGRSFRGTPFYDIRSDIRYLAPEVRDLVAWANDRGYNIKSPMAEINTYQTVFFPARDKILILNTVFDDAVMSAAADVRDRVAGVSFNNYVDLTKQNPIMVYANAAGRLTIPLTNEAEFLSQDFPLSMKAGERRRIVYRFKNTGTKNWLAGWYRLGRADGDRLKSLGITPEDLTLKRTVSPGEVAEISFELQAPQQIGKYQLALRLREMQGDFFGPTSSLAVLEVTQ